MRISSIYPGAHGTRLAAGLFPLSSWPPGRGRRLVFHGCLPADGLVAAAGAEVYLVVSGFWGWMDLAAFPFFAGRADPSPSWVRYVREPATLEPRKGSVMVAGKVMDELLSSYDLWVL